MTNIRNRYVEWLINKVTGGLYNGPISFRKLLYRLHDIPFRYVILHDENRAKDGIDLRYHLKSLLKYPLLNFYRNKDCLPILS